MILVDTSVWVDHLRRHDAHVVHRLTSNELLVHPWVIGEVACGVFPRRTETLALLQELPAVSLASNAEILAFIDRRSLAGRGIGYVDVHLLASTLITPGARLWTRDRRLAVVAEEVGVLFEEDLGA